MNLLQMARELERYSLLAVDGEIGRVEAFYFDDTAWAIRYLVVNTGGWLTGGHVLISPVAIGDVDEENRTINIELTRHQIENSPSVSADRPVSRRYELAYYQYYGWTPYWELVPLSGFPMAGMPMAPPPTPDKISMPGADETHLRSTVEVKGYAIAARDGEIWHVEDFIVDTQYWVIRYLKIDTRNWLPGKHILVNPGWIEEISWTTRTVSVGLSCEAIKGAPDFDPSKAISRGYETRLFKHYGRPVYWRRGNEKG